MNVLLLEPGEVDGDRVTVDGRRATHLRDVLGVVVGSRVRAGVVGGGLGTAEVVEDGGTITLRLAITDPPSTPLPVDVVLAVPRPKVLSRTIEALASFGVASITLTNAWRVDKSYLSSPRLEPAALAAAALLGAEQGVTTHVPPITVHRRLMQMLEQPFDQPVRLVAHPSGVPIELAVTPGRIALAIGPEGGWIQRELDTFVERGWACVSLGAPILRVESAVAALLGQIVLLQRLTG